MLGPSVQMNFKPVEGWEQLPEGMTHKDVADVAVDSKDRVYLLTRLTSQVVVYDRHGVYLSRWGAGSFSEFPHGITIGPSDEVYIVDEARHTVEVYSTDGERISQLGPFDQPSATGADSSIPNIYDRIASIEQAAGPFNRPTKLAVAPGGDLYVTDGYGNARVHHFDAEGALIGSWGSPGTGPGEFHLPHGLAIGPDGRVYICDRENDRIQVFTDKGDFIEEWTDFRRPAAVFHRNGHLYISELSWRVGHQTWRHGIVEEPQPSRITITDLEGGVVERFGEDEPCAPGGFTAPHGICVDSVGDIYVAEVTWTSGGKGTRFPPDCHTFVKLTSSG